MKVKKFHGTNSSAAMRQVRAALGEDAVILSNRKVAGGVEILAIADEDMADIVHAPSSPAEDLAQEQAAAVATVEVRSLLRAAGNAPAKNERRVQHEIPGVQTVAAQGEAALAEQVKAMRAALEQLSTPAQAGDPAQAELIAEMKAMRESFQHQIDGLARASEAQKAMVEREKTQADRNLTAENARLNAELGTLRSLVERELAGLSWNDAVRRNPVRAEVVRRCLEAGFSAATARVIAESVPTDLASREVPKWLCATIERNLPLAEAEEIVDKGGVYALVGPTGVGKTTTAAKLAARCAVKFGAKSLALITADTYRIGAPDQLRIYGKILGVPVNTVHDAASLAELLSSYSDKHLVLIDTVGLGQRDARVADQIASLVANNVKRLVVLNAAAQPETLEDVIDVYSGEGLAGCILSKVDEAVKIGGALNALLRHGLKLHFIANGQRVPEDLHSPNARYLAHRALRAHTPAALAMSDEEIAYAAAPTLIAATQTAQGTR
jgi:flagellar biosynthesis protein FlhF